MRKIFLSFFFLISTVVLAAPSVTVLAYNQPTEYIHAYQDMYLNVSGLGNITINIGELITITSSTGAELGIVNGSNQLLTANMSYVGGVWTLMFVARGDMNFVQDSQYTITVDIGDGDPFVKVVTFNKQYVVGSVTINANSKYRESTIGGDYFKSGLNNSDYSDANLSVTGTIHYRYAPDVFPSANIAQAVELFINNDIKGRVSIGENGMFSFTGFSMPTVAVGAKINVIVSVDVDGPTLYNDNESQFPIAIENTLPDVSALTLVFIPATSSISEGTTINPVAGYFNGITVSFVVEGSVANPEGGSNISDNIWVVDPFNSANGFFTPRASQFIVTFTYNNINFQGSKELVIRVLDNVYNYVTTSVRVTIDLTPPNEFVVTIQPDIDNTSEQLSPELGWYNDQTVSFSWAVPVDDSGILAYQFKSEGWNTWSAVEGIDIVEGVSQIAIEAWVTVDQGGDNPRTVWVRAIDKAGNIKKVATTVKVDTIVPTVTLQLAPDLTGKENVLVNILPQLGWYNDVNVKWFCGAEDSGQLRDKSYKYRYVFGTSNTATIDWLKLVSEVTVTPSVGVTNNIFMLSAVDKAGNIGMVTAQIFVDLLDPEPVGFGISFNACSIKGEGVAPEPKWYNQTTVDLTITWSSVIENGELYKVLLYVGQTSVPTTHIILGSNESISFNNISLIANDATPIYFKALLVDKAGNFKEIYDYIYSDVVIPNNFQVVLADDSDSKADGLVPEEWYYDNPELMFMIMFSQADPTARNRPFQFRVNNNDWGEATSNLYITNFSVSENICNLVETRYIDKAGNVLTSSFMVTVDTVSPAGVFSLALKDCEYTQIVQATPDVGWYNKTTVSFDFSVLIDVVITDTGNLRDFPYFLKGETDLDWQSGKQNSKNIAITVANGGALQRTIVGAIADKAGNIIKSSTTVFVDTDSPVTNFEVRILPDADAGIDGIWPEVGWHANPWINFNWDQAGDGAGLLHTTPYRVRSDGTNEWSEFQTGLSYAGIYVSPSNNITQNIYIQVRDRAGNLETKLVGLKVDTTDPVIELFVSPQIPLEGVTYNIFKQVYGLGCSFPLSGWVNTENLTLTWNIVGDEWFPSVSFRVKSLASADYGASLNSTLRQTELTVSAIDQTTIDLFIKVWDKAGNSAQATTGIKVDIIQPKVTINMQSQQTSTVMPFVNSQDVLCITLNCSEPISVTPFVCYTVTEDSQEVATLNVVGFGSTWWCSLNMTDVVQDGLHVFKVLLIDDAGNIAPLPRGYNSFVKLAPGVVPTPQEFFAQDMLTSSKNLTNADFVSVSFLVGTSINSYLIMEGPLAGLVNEANNKPFNPLSAQQHSALRYSISYQLDSDYSKNGVRTLYLWVKNDAGQGTMTAVTCDIVLDKQAPKISIFPDSDNPSSLELVKAKYTAVMMVTHNIEFTGGVYVERLPVTPQWEITIKNGNSFIASSVNLSPYLLSNSASPDFKAVWYVSYDLREFITGNVATIYDGIFNVIVTDQAGNTTTSIQTFTIDTKAPKLPIMVINNGAFYTSSLNIEIVLSKNESSVLPPHQYSYYKIFDNNTSSPRQSDYYNNDWPRISNVEVVSFSMIYNIKDSSQGTKDIYAWVANSNAQGSLTATYAMVVYDSIPPTCTIFIQPVEETEGNPFMVTMSFSEQLDLNQNRTLRVVDSTGNVLQTAEISLNGQISENYIYVAQVVKVSGSIDTRELLMDKYISINVFDLAGNNFQDLVPFSRQLRVLGCYDYFARARSHHLSKYNVNSLEVGKSGIPVILAELKAVSRDIHVSGVNLQLDNMMEFKIDRFYIYLDKDNDGLFDIDVDTKLGEKVYQGSEKTMNLPLVNEQIVNNQTTTTIFLVLDVFSGANAEDENFIGFGFVTNNPADVSYYESTNPILGQADDGIVATFNITKTRLNISYLPRIDEADIVTSNINSGERVVVKKFALRSWIATSAGTGNGNNYGALWEGLNIKINYSSDKPMLPDKITRVAIYRDNGSGKFYDDPSLLVSSGEDRFKTAQQTSVNLEFLPVNVGGDDPVFYIVVDSDKSLGLNQVFSFEIVSPDSFNFQNGDSMIDSGEFPVRTITLDSDYYISQISIESYKNTEKYVYQDTELNVLKFKLNVDYKGYQFLPKIFYFDVYKEEGDILLNDDVDVLLYKYSDVQLDNNFSYLEPIDISVLDSQVGGELPGVRVRVTFSPGINPETDSQVLATENFFALIIKPRPTSIPGREGVFKIKFVNHDTAADNISFQETETDKAYGEIVNEQDVTTNRIQIVDMFQPTKPIISGNAYTETHRNIRYFYSTSVNIANNGIDSLMVMLGSTSGGSDIFSGLVSVNNVVNSKNIILATGNIQIIDPAKFLKDNTTYNISLRAKATDGTDEFWSITGDFSFHTDFTPPWIGTNKLTVLAKWDEKIHDIIWSPFTEPESKIEYYIVEMLSGQSLNWIRVATNNPLSTQYSIPDVEANTPYQYRVKAVNAAGGHSEYLESGERIMTTNTTETIFSVSNYPNPFYSAFQTTRIVFSLNQNIDAYITLYDSMGHFVRRFDSKQITKESGSTGSGYYCFVDWDGRNESGQFVSKGGYFAIIEAAPYASGGKPAKVVRMIGVIH